jgi:isoaspartyl peptidase/L-asparaginase-like protein (Ntn-hydrolase superfamily)
MQIGRHGNNALNRQIIPKFPDSESSSTHKIQDTVGAIAWDADGGLAAGVSRSVMRIVYCVETTDIRAVVAYC